MFIYNGKFTWLSHASNEAITIVFPAAFSLNDPVSAYWQWSTDFEVKKANAANSGVIHTITTTADGYTRLHISFGYYTFDVSVCVGYKVLTATMRNPSNGASDPFELAAMHTNPTNSPSTVVYTGRLEWFPYAKGEMTTLVVPYGVTEGAFFGLYHQWTVDAKGEEKANMSINDVFQNVKYGADGTVTAAYKAGYYAYHFTFRGKEGSFVLSNPKGDKSLDNKFAVIYAL